MKLEVLNERIEKLNQNISKKKALIKKMEDRITKNIAKLNKLGFTECLDNPYNIDRNAENFEKGFDLMYSISNAKDSIKNAEQMIKEYSEKLERYQEELTIETEKANSRNIKAILEFLESWKANVRSFYEAHTQKWEETLQEYYKANSSRCKFRNYTVIDTEEAKETYKRLKMEEEKAKEKHKLYSYLDAYMERKNGSYILNTEN